MSRKIEASETANESGVIEISENELTELRSLFKSALSLNKKYRAALDALQPLHRDVLKQLEGGSESNADTIAEHMRIINAMKGLSQRDKSNYSAIAGTYGAALADMTKKRDQAKEAAEVLITLAESIGSRRRSQLAGAYQAGLKSAAIAIRPFCEDENEAEDMARTSSRVSALHARIIGNPSVSSNEIDRALGKASAVLNDMEEPIPTFS